MGNMCTSNDIYQQIKQQYDEDFQKFVVGQQIKKNLRLKINQFKKKIKRIATFIQAQGITKVNSKQQEVKLQFEECKAQLLKKHVDVKKLQKRQNCKIQQILKYSTIKQQFNAFKVALNKKMAQQRQKIEKQFEEIRIVKKEMIVKQQPNLEFYNLLPDKIKEEVYIRATKEFKQKIQSQTTSFLFPLQKAFSINYNTRFQIILSQNQLQLLTTASKREMAQQVNNVIGSMDEQHAVVS